MALSQATDQTRSHRRWRALIDAFLKELVEATQCDYAAFVELGARDKYGFATRSDPLPDIDWHSLIALLSEAQQSNPGFAVITQRDAVSAKQWQALSEHFNQARFDVVATLPLLDEERIIGVAALFGKVPPVDVDALNGELRSRIEALAGITARAIGALTAGPERTDGSVHRRALRRLPEGVLMADGQGVVIEANDAFTELTGIPAESLLGRNLRERPVLGTDCDYLVARLLESGQPFEVVARLGPPDQEAAERIPGEEEAQGGRFIRLRGTAYPLEGDPPSGMLLLADDVTRDVMARREASQRERQHSQEIELASDLQQNFFPANYQKKRIRLATRLIAARELAGDFFDTFDLGPNTLGLVIGDVVGKGIPGSLMAMSVHGMIANQVGALTPPMKVLEQVNGALYHQVRGDYWYATCFFAKIHVTRLRVTYARAGHELPLWWHAETNEVTFLEGEGLPLGIFPDSRYVTQQIVLNEGDKLLLYTDGLTDAVNAAGERFGHDRLVELFRKNSTLSAKNLLRLIENTVEEFRGGREQMDDIAVALISVVPDSWTSLTIPPYSFQEILEDILGELALRGVDDDTRFKVRLSLDECVTNAYRHGHRGDQRKAITVSYLIEPDHLTIKVRDMGQGFDFGLIPDPTLDENLMSPGGRGVFITLKMMDKVSFNDVGNEVTLIKHLHGPEGRR